MSALENKIEESIPWRTWDNGRISNPKHPTHPSPTNKKQLPWHKQAAVMVTDIVGYTDLIIKDEERALQVLAENRRIQKLLIECHKGKWIKEIGDGILACFCTASEAVHCALDIQKAVENIPDLKLHIGIHQSPVIFVNGDVFGLGVNIAFRIQELASPGKIWVSETVAIKILLKKEIKAKLVKISKLKHVKKLVGVYEVNGAHKA